MPDDSVRSHAKPDTRRVECWRCERCGRVSTHAENNTFQIEHSEHVGGFTASTYVILPDSIKAWTTSHCRYSGEAPPCPWVRMVAVPDSVCGASTENTPC